MAISRVDLYYRTNNQTDTRDAVYTAYRLRYNRDYNILDDRPANVSEERWKAMINHIVKHGSDHID